MMTLKYQNLSLPEFTLFALSLVKFTFKYNRKLFSML